MTRSRNEWLVLRFRLYISTSVISGHDHADYSNFDSIISIGVRPITSVASFLVLGGGGGARPPNVPTEKRELICASERAPQKHIISGLQIHLHVQSMQFPFITYGMALYIDSI